MVTAKTLLGLLDPASDQYGGEDAVNAFLVGGGPSILRYRLDSMDGDWMAEARNGATDMMDRIARLPGLQKTCVTIVQLLCFRLPWLDAGYNDSNTALRRITLAGL